MVLFAALILLALFLQHPPSPIDQAAAALESGQLQDAERLLRAAIRAQPDDARAAGLLGVVLDQLKRYDEAGPLLERAAALAPGSASVWNNLGNHYLATANSERARAAFLKVIALQPAHPNANLQLARLAAAGRQGPEILRCLDRLPPAAAAVVEVRLLRARALDWAGRAPEAQALLAELERQAGTGAPLAFSIGMAHAEAKRYADAERAFNRALESEPANFDILYNLGLAALRAGRLDRARDILQAALQQRPDDVEALFAFAQSCLLARREELATFALVRAQTLAPARADVLELLARCFYTLGYYGDAAETWAKYLKLRPADETARRERAFSQALTGGESAALPDLLRYVQKHPRDAVGLLELALAQRRSDSERALRNLDRALEIDPANVDARFARAVLYYERAEPARAVADLQFATAREPDNVRMLDRLGQVYLQTGKPEQAAGVLERAANLAPGDGRVLMHYSQALRALGRDADLREVMARFRRLPKSDRQRGTSGLFEYLTLPPAEQQARYAANLQKLIDTNPNEPGLKVRWAKLMLAQGKPADAAAACGEARRLAAEPKLLDECGRALLQHGEYNAARAFYRELVSADPHAPARLDLAISVFHTGAPAAALEELDRIPEPQRRGDYYLVRAQVLDAAGRFEDAVAALNRGFRAEPTRAELYVEASSFLLKHQRNREALELLQAAARALLPSPEMLLNQAIALELTGRYEDAQVLLKDLELRWPEWHRPYLAHGILLQIHNQAEPAKPLIEAAIALGADSAEAWFYLALVTTRTNPDDVAGARNAVAKALERNPADPYIRSLAGKLALASGDVESAVAHLKEATRLFPNFAEAYYVLAGAYRAQGQDELAFAAMKQFRAIREKNPRPEMEAPPATETLLR